MIILPMTLLGDLHQYCRSKMPETQKSKEQEEMWNLGDERLCMCFHAGTFQGNSDVSMSSALSQFRKRAVRWREPRAAPPGPAQRLHPGGDPRGICCAPHCGTAAGRHFSTDLRTQGHAVINTHLWLIEKTVILPRRWLWARRIVRHSIKAAARPSAGLAVPVFKMSGWTERWSQCCAQGLLSEGRKWTCLSSCINHLDISSFRCRCKWEVHLRTKESWDTFPALTCKLLQVLS